MHEIQSNNVDRDIVDSCRVKSLDGLLFEELESLKLTRKRPCNNYAKKLKLRN